ncbi:FAD-dependent oxidoreductase [Pseudonocardia benzenivorans]|uniref:FAD dependent oxidoreductase n=2 Tax=Pseudonocardia TaxID=1847 RepID=F4CLW2_PSEUX|nr:NAD(P)/FAD-dependent oxidoreductase [Pseudonocardia dioxanivorans]AEA28244.1 FAD dependent oxidoreductase [Pseudonocardia dioxanivorans CB1190]
MSTTRHAEIAGAGLGGLALAIALAQKGWSVRVHERSDDLRMFGAGIWLWENGLRSLEALGVEQTATARAKRIETMVARDQDGRPLLRRSFGTEDRLILPPRADLYDALIARVGELGVEVELRSTAIGITPRGELEIEDGKTLQADLVVAADGVFSRLREALLLTRRVDYLDEGYTRLLIPRRPDDPDTEVTEYWSGSRRLLYDPCTDDVDYVCLCCPVDDEAGRRVPVDKESWLASFPMLGGIIERIDDSGRWDRAMRVTPRAWSRGVAAIVGDAAHGQPPNLGQGANLTFQNCLALAEYLERDADVATALARWEREERPLTDHIQRWTDLYGRVASAWPDRFAHRRSQVLETVTRIPWVDRQLNKAARHRPLGAR